MLRVDTETALAKLCLIGGAWQESCDTVGIFVDRGRGYLCLVVDLFGPPQDRGSLARDLIRTAQREFLAGRGSVTLALTQAVRAVNAELLEANADAAQVGQQAGITAAVLREQELFIAQAGPGLTCHVRGRTLRRYPGASPWFEPVDTVQDCPTPGAVPLGDRSDYVPDVFHVSLEPGDILLFSSRTLAHLLTEEELLDTLAEHHPDEIIERLEEVAGSTDLSIIAVRLAGESRGAESEPDELTSREPEFSQVIWAEPASDEPTYAGLTPTEPAEIQEDTEELNEERAAGAVGQRAAQVSDAAPFPVSPEVHRLRDTTALKNVPPAVSRTQSALQERERIDWTRSIAWSSRVMTSFVRGGVHLLSFSASAFLPDPEESKAAEPSRWIDRSKIWRLAALLFPLILLGVSGAAWVSYRVEAQRGQGAQITQWLKQANTAMEMGTKLASSDKNAARKQFNDALTLIRQARSLTPNDSGVRDAYYQVQDLLDSLANTAILPYVAKFGTFSDPKANPSRLVSHWPDLFVLDRGLGRVYRYTMNDAGSAATPISGDGVILKTGDNVSDRTVGELIDMAWIDTGRLLVLERNGTFWLFEPKRGQWTARAASDGSQWAAGSLVTSYLGNLYLLDPSRNQILKYTAGTDGLWTVGVPFMMPGMNVNLSNAVDFAVDGDVWVLRPDGTIWRLTNGNLVDFTPRDLDVTMLKPTALFTSSSQVGLYVVDSGNQRILQLDKATGKLGRQFRPRRPDRRLFDNLKTATVDETNRKLYFVNGNEAYLATIPQ